MQRCLELAKLGAGYVAPNPMVGAVLVYEDQIIGEGWHQHFGEAHAEVNCINSVKEEDRQFISSSILYVSLEPCAHFGKTPPCADLIIQHKIPKVVIGCRDPFMEVNARLAARAGTDGNDTVGQGKGIEKLKAVGVTVEVGLLVNECSELNKRFFTFHTVHRPYIILKWAETADGMMASLNPSEGGTLDSDSSNKHFINQNVDSAKTTTPLSIFQNPPLEGREASRLLISNEYSNRMVHKWRSEEAAILVGTNTALRDDPELTTRLWTGPSPLRLVLDMNLKLPSSLKLFNGEVRTIVFNTKKHEDQENLFYYRLTNDVNIVPQILNALYQLKVQSVLVEGGAQLLQSFIDKGLWDEARVIMNDELRIKKGLNAPLLGNSEKVNEEKMLSDIISIYKPKRS